jgi:hypothetical protein
VNRCALFGNPLDHGIPNLGIFQSFESSFISVTLAFHFLRDAVTIAFPAIVLSIFEFPMMQFADAPGC